MPGHGREGDTIVTVPRRVPGWLAAGTLLVVSTLICLVVAEIFLRSTRRLETFFDPLQYEPDVASEGWKRAFARDYAQLRKKGLMGPDLAGYVHDPDLGWDTPDHVRGARRYGVDKRPGVFRVAVVGDSFTYGAEVGDDETYPQRLEAHLAHSEVLNMGVRAYGIDQIALKYLTHGRALRPDLLVVAIFTLDYLRTPLTFYRFAKPLYVLHPDTGALTLTRTPVPPPDQVYETLRRELGPFSFTYALLRQGYRRAFEGAPDFERYYDTWDPLVRGILGRLVEVAREDRTPVLFVLIEHGLELASDEAVASRHRERKRLWDIFRGLSVDAIDLGEALSKSHSRRTVYERMYIHHRGVPSGHFTPLGNDAVAQEIARYVHERFGVALTSAK
jgi:hypothetical protein